MKGIEVKKKLQNSGFSLKMVADAMGETPQNLNSMLNAQDIKTGILERIAGAINKSLYFFFDDKVKLMTDEEILLFDKNKAIRLPEGSRDGIPLIPVASAAGFGSGEFQVMEYECERYVVPLFKGAEFLIPVRGSSMYPKYSSGDVVACKRVPLNDIFFQWNKVYVLDTDQGPIIKRVKQGGDENHILIVSENEKYDPFELHKNKLHGVAIVIGVIRLE
jgi:phage repressor protein C with HTH and peptisase S24 domain